MGPVAIGAEKETRYFKCVWYLDSPSGDEPQRVPHRRAGNGIAFLLPPSSRLSPFSPQKSPFRQLEAASRHTRWTGSSTNAGPRLAERAFSWVVH